MFKPDLRHALACHLVDIEYAHGPSRRRAQALHLRGADAAQHHFGQLNQAVLQIDDGIQTLAEKIGITTFVRF